MSYILDALKRAEAQRERGAVPGLNAQPTPLPAPARASGSRQPLLWTLAALLALILAGAAGWFWRAGAPAAPAKPVAAAAPAVPEPAAPAASAATPPVATPGTVAAASPTPPAAVAAPTAAPVAAPVAAPISTPAPASPTAKATPAAAAKTTPAPIAAAPAAKPPLLTELPADLRGQLPKMTITGAVYSKDPAQRLLLINNQVFTQGGNIAPGLDLVEIQPHSAIFNFQGTRFAMPH